MKTIFTINITNWEKHNGTKKKNHRYFFMENRFFEDSKISQLKQIEVLLYLKCLTIAADLSSSCVQVHAGLMPKRWRVDDKLMENCCKTLQQFQLLTYEKNTSLLIEKKRKEENIKEKKGDVVEVVENSSREIVGLYCDEWKSRYGASAPITPKVAGQLKKFLKDHGWNKAERYLKAYFSMPDQWFITKRHDVGTLLTNLNSVAQFSETGRMVTKKELNQIDQTISTQNLIEEIRRNGI